MFHGDREPVGAFVDMGIDTCGIDIVMGLCGGAAVPTIRLKARKIVWKRGTGRSRIGYHLYGYFVSFIKIQTVNKK